MSASVLSQERCASSATLGSSPHMQSSKQLCTQSVSPTKLPFRNATPNPSSLKLQLVASDGSWTWWYKVQAVENAHNMEINWSKAEAGGGQFKATLSSKDRLCSERREKQTREQKQKKMKSTSATQYDLIEYFLACL